MDSPWQYSIVHNSACKVIEEQTLWGQTVCRVWLPNRSRSPPRPAAAAGGVNDYIQQASVSVMSNIAEGFERYSRQEFKQFLSFARGSCAEVRSQIQLAKSLGYVADSDCSKIYEKCIGLSRAIGGLRSSLDRSARG